MKLKQVFIKCHDNDFWSYYRGALFSLYYWYKFSYRDRYSVELLDIEKFIQKSLDNLYELSHPNAEQKKFPYKVKVTINDEAIQTYEKESEWGNSECAYMELDSFEKTPNGNIEDFIFNV